MTFLKYLYDTLTNYPFTFSTFSMCYTNHDKLLSGDVGAVPVSEAGGPPFSYVAKPLLQPVAPLFSWASVFACCAYIITYSYISVKIVMHIFRTY